MIEGPRPVRTGEKASLSQLVDCVFESATSGTMFHRFPALFEDENNENLIVCVDNGRVISHVGTLERWASINGCTVRVACIGAVATYEEHRKKGLASKLFKVACDNAFAHGVDIMLISGDRGLYRQAGAADVGCDSLATVSWGAAKALHSRDVAVRDITGPEFRGCSALYETKAAHFIRPHDDWKWYEQTRVAWCAETDILGVYRRDALCAYLIVARENKHGVASVVEFAGENTAIAAALKQAMLHQGARSLKMHLQRGDVILRELLADAGAPTEPETADGTLLIINFPQLMTRLKPYLGHHIGEREAKTLEFRQNGAKYLFQAASETFVLDAGEAAQAIFGHPERRFFAGILESVFPVHTLYYGLNYT